MGKQEFISIVGKIKYSNFELRFFKKNELDVIYLTQLEFELLVDNLTGQEQLIKKYKGTKVDDLVAIFKNEEGTTFNICFNSKTIKAYNFLSKVPNIKNLQTMNHKKVYSNFLNINS